MAISYAKLTEMVDAAQAKGTNLGTPLSDFQAHPVESAVAMIVLRTLSEQMFAKSKIKKYLKKIAKGHACRSPANLGSDYALAAAESIHREPDAREHLDVDYHRNADWSMVPSLNQG